MPASQPAFFTSSQGLLTDFGRRLGLARLRRKLSIDTVAARAGISRMTLFRAEKGAPTVSLGTYLRILEVLHLQNDVALLAKDDELGRRLQDIALNAPSRTARKQAKPAPNTGSAA
jgi:transcriptional regulator with XRE-family HTH domain